MANLFRRLNPAFFTQLRQLPRYSEAHAEKQLISEDVLSQNSEVNASRAQKSGLVIRSGIKQKPPKSQRAAHVLRNIAFDEPRPIVDGEGHLVYTKMADQDARITKIMSTVKTPGRGAQLMLLEGTRLITEALQAGCHMEYLLFSRQKELSCLKPFLPSTGRLYKMPYREMQVWSHLTTNPGIMGIFQIPSADLVKVKDPLPLTIICDNIREPGNLGAILRTSSGVGCAQVVLTKGCVNLWDPKVLRSACGAHFRVKTSINMQWEQIGKMLPPEAKVFIADNNTVISSRENIETVHDLVYNIPLLSYSAVDYRGAGHVVLVIGGETEGVSGESYTLATRFNGARINVPLSNGVDSLNAGTALGIVAFEVKRQLSTDTS